MNVAMLHFAPRAMDLARNFAWIERAARRAAGEGASLLMMPELALSGYDFAVIGGTDWIADLPRTWYPRFAELARATNLAILATLPERHVDSGLLHNCAVHFDHQGEVRAVHRKIAVIPGGSEAWSVGGSSHTIIEVGAMRAAVIICADACLSRLPDVLAQHRPEAVLSAAAWSPGLHGPEGEWERLSRTLQVPVLVSNRTGVDGWDFSRAESLLVTDGKRIASWRGADPTLILVEDLLSSAPRRRSRELA